MAKALTEKQVELLKHLSEGVLRFPQNVHEKKAFEKAELLGYATSSLQQRSAVVQADGKTLREFQRAYKLRPMGAEFLGRPKS